MRTGPSSENTEETKKEAMNVEMGENEDELENKNDPNDTSSEANETKKEDAKKDPEQEKEAARRKAVADQEFYEKRKKNQENYALERGWTTWVMVSEVEEMQRQKELEEKLGIDPGNQAHFSLGQGSGLTTHGEFLKEGVYKIKLRDDEEPNKKEKEHHFRVHKDKSISILPPPSWDNNGKGARVAYGLALDMQGYQGITNMDYSVDLSAEAVMKMKPSELSIQTSSLRMMMEEAEKRNMSITWEEWEKDENGAFVLDKKGDKIRSPMGVLMDRLTAAERQALYDYRDELLRNEERAKVLNDNHADFTKVLKDIPKDDRMAPGGAAEQEYKDKLILTTKKGGEGEEDKKEIKSGAELAKSLVDETKALQTRLDKCNAASAKITSYLDTKNAAVKEFDETTIARHGKTKEIKTRLDNTQVKRVRKIFKNKNAEEIKESLVTTVEKNHIAKQEERMRVYIELQKEKEDIERKLGIVTKLSEDAKEHKVFDAYDKADKDTKLTLPEKIKELEDKTKELDGKIKDAEKKDKPSEKDKKELAELKEEKTKVEAELKDFKILEDLGNVSSKTQKIDREEKDLQVSKTHLANTNNPDYLASLQNIMVRQEQEVDDAIKDLEKEIGTIDVEIKDIDTKLKVIKDIGKPTEKDLAEKKELEEQKTTLEEKKKPLVEQKDALEKELPTIIALETEKDPQKVKAGVEKYIEKKEKKIEDLKEKGVSSIHKKTDTLAKAVDPHNRNGLMQKDATRGEDLRKMKAEIQQKRTAAKMP